MLALLMIVAALPIGVICHGNETHEPDFESIAAAAADTETLTSLVSALTAAALVETLDDPELVATVFVPTNEAFIAALEYLGVSFDDLAADTDTLTDVLLYHVVPGVKAMSDDLMDGMELETLADGETLTVNMTSGAVQIVGVGSTAQVIIPDITAGEGVVHVIDAVLLPFDV
eukprot:TRINITY_DN967_c0_g1_i1.p3 TRINITY_DN967_c0_g1~~TRINITY_DN967_c0_g1_i1.p3  ORF type:complete len:173 (-),score=43.83 TRINITY_DN967_c0_g1_i1:367-885(-)